MTRPIIDAGPGLNFLSLNKERLLFSVLGPLSVPETVEAVGSPAESPRYGYRPVSQTFELACPPPRWPYGCLTPGRCSVEGIFGN